MPGLDWATSGMTWQKKTRLQYKRKNYGKQSRRVHYPVLRSVTTTTSKEGADGWISPVSTNSTENHARLKTHENHESAEPFHFELGGINGRGDQLVDKLELHRPLELSVTTDQPSRHSLPDTGLDQEVVADGDVVMELQFLPEADQLDLPHQLDLLHERRLVRHRKDANYKLRSKKLAKIFQRRLDKDVGREHRPQHFLGVVVCPPLDIQIVDLPRTTQGTVAGQAILKAEIAKPELVARSGLNGTNHLRPRKLQERLIELWIVFLLHDCHFAEAKAPPTILSSFSLHAHITPHFF